MLTCAAVAVRPDHQDRRRADSASSRAPGRDGAEQGARSFERAARTDIGCEFLLYAHSTDNRGQRLRRRRRHPGGSEDVRRARRLRHQRDDRDYGAEHARRQGLGGRCPPTGTAQIEAVLGDIGADAIKIGMLGNAAIVSAVARRCAPARAAGCRRRSRDDRERWRSAARARTPSPPCSPICCRSRTSSRPTSPRRKSWRTCAIGVTRRHARGRPADPRRWGRAWYW